MSAFVVLFERNGQPINPATFAEMMGRLTHRGPNGRGEYISSHIAMGHWLFRSTPEEADEIQPLHISGLPFRLVLDGRLDNRSELLPQLELPPSTSDAALILHAYARWGKACFEAFLGEYALVLFDESAGQIICARDALGDRTLYHAVHGSLVAIASEPWAVTAALPVVTLDEIGIASYFAFQPPPNFETFFKQVNELPPAQVMTLTDGGEQKFFSWSPDPSRRTRYKHEEEYAREFRSLLEESVRARMRAAKPVGVLMSGGLDSTSIACLAAQMSAPAQLKTVSFVFDDPSLKECDERVYMDAVRDQWNTDSIQLPCDDLWPYKNWGEWEQYPNRPDGNIFRWIKHKMYDNANKAGLGVLMTGEGGDHLYGAGLDWLSDLLLEGKISASLQGLRGQIRNRGWENVRASRIFERTLRNLTKQALPASLVKKLRAAPFPPEWLTPFAASRWSPSATRFPESLERHENLLSLQTASGITAEIPLANRYNIELRHPYRDRRLIEYVFSLPAYMLYRDGLYKHILRVSMKDTLPEIIRSRPRPTALLKFYKLGMEKEMSVIETCLSDPAAVWKKYIRADWLSSHIKISANADQVGTESMIAWLCVSFESWYKCVATALVDRSIFQ